MPLPFNLSKADLEKIVLIGVAGFIVVFVIIQFGIMPSFAKLSDLSKKIVVEKDSLEKAKAIIISKPQLKARLESMQGKLKEAEKALPPHSDMPNILQNIANMAYDTKVKIIKIEPLRSEKPAEHTKADKNATKQAGKQNGNNKPKALYTEIPIQVEAKGSYHALGEFINEIEMADNVMGIGDIEIKANPDDIQNHNARILIVAFVMREESSAK